MEKKSKGKKKGDDLREKIIKSLLGQLKDPVDEYKRKFLIFSKFRNNFRLVSRRPNKERLR